MVKWRSLEMLECCIYQYNVYNLNLGLNVYYFYGFINLNNRQPF